MDHLLKSCTLGFNVFANDPGLSRVSNLLSYANASLPNPDPKCVDYIFFRGPYQVRSASQLQAPSDHASLLVEFEDTRPEPTQCEDIRKQIANNRGRIRVLRDSEKGLDPKHYPQDKIELNEIVKEIHDLEKEIQNLQQQAQAAGCLSW